MRRSFALALASLTLGTGSLFFAAQGCSTTALGVQDLCGWLADECNCYRRFGAGVGVGTDTPKCGLRIGADGEAIDPATGAAYQPPAVKATVGKFAKREALDICVLDQGGQVVFDPPLNPLLFPPQNFAFKIVDGNAELCGNGSYGADGNSFSIGFPAPEGTGGAGGSGGAGGTGGTGGTAEGVSCRESAQKDPASEAISYGTFTSAATDIANVITTTCPNNDEQHRFNLLQLDKCDGTDAEENYKSIMPTVEIKANAGGVQIRGQVRLRVLWPPTKPVDSLDGATPERVEYFDCSFPGANDPCHNEELDGQETDVDCGYVACGGNCQDGQKCTIDLDCISGACNPDAMGFNVCTPAACGDGAKTGPEACDDGNMVAGDGCSDQCKLEAGFTCPTPGMECEDIDECALMKDNCEDTATCENTVGSFVCTCPPGTSSDGMGCFAGCGDGDKLPPEGCDDGNTATGDGCNEHCAVEPGFTCMGEGPLSCKDIDECATMKDNCNDAETCENTTGSFNCNCLGPKSAKCNGTCIDVSMNVFNCGVCFQECLAGEVCTDGVCGPPPP